MGLKEKLLGVAGSPKQATLVIYWADTRKVLTHLERLVLSNYDTVVVDITPLEVLLEDTKTKKKIVVRGITDDVLPSILASSEG